ncbi:hypothetical protein O3M35_013285 [Rhynocoris fuscipes]|uniref:Mitochondrial ribosomal protein S18C n=1 Tax=Rhynocoris fuscipes TaxID=488301 RepID=A0AAW1CDU9_9HEMI
MALEVTGKLLTNTWYCILRRSFTSTAFKNEKYTNTSNNDMPIEMENPFVKEKAQCILCKLNIKPDYKNTKLLSQFVSPFTGRIYGRYITGLCKRKQEAVVKEIIKAQNAGFMPYYNKDPIYLEDPKLFNPDRPVRPHDF